MNTGEFNGITELSELTEFFMKQREVMKCANNIAVRRTPPKWDWELRHVGYENPLKCSHSVNSENSVIPSKQQFYI